MFNMSSSAKRFSYCKFTIEEEKNIEYEETKYLRNLNDLLNKEDSFYKDIYLNADTIYIDGSSTKIEKELIIRLVEDGLKVLVKKRF